MDTTTTTTATRSPRPSPTSSSPSTIKILPKFGFNWRQKNEREEISLCCLYARLRTTERALGLQITQYCNLYRGFLCPKIDVTCHWFSCLRWRVEYTGRRP